MSRPSPHSWLAHGYSLNRTTPGLHLPSTITEKDERLLAEKIASLPVAKSPRRTRSKASPKPIHWWQRD
jgi:hypothetical protein